MRRLMFISHPHKYQRYDTVGDYQDVHGVTLFTISEMENEQYEYLVAVHELVEKILVDARGICLTSIDNFDQDYEARRQDGDDSEPGDDPQAPYHAEHVFATTVERLLAGELGVDWEAYDKAVTGLHQ
jgi:hypothetical protein